MNTEALIMYVIYGSLALLGWIIRQQYLKLERLKDSVAKLDKELARQSQENSELYNNIKRIDINIDKLFDRVDKLLTLLNNK
jgi:cell division protein FtsB